MERPIPYWLLILIGALLFIGFGATMAWVTWARPAMAERSFEEVSQEESFKAVYGVIGINGPVVIIEEDGIGMEREIRLIVDKQKKVKEIRSTLKDERGIAISDKKVKEIKGGL